MLTHISIRNFVLIEKLDLEFSDGLTVLTGETGAGKSIILDALGLALGARSEKGLVREPAKTGTVTVRFEPPFDHPVFAILTEQDMASEGEIVLRRAFQPDGRSRGYVNDEPVGITLLKRIGNTLVEVHGQMDQHGLMDTKTHTQLLDIVGEHQPQLRELHDAFDKWVELNSRRSHVFEQAERNRGEREHLAFRLEDLTRLSPEPGEERRLSDERLRLQNREKFLDVLHEADEALGGADGALAKLGAVQRRIDRSADFVRTELGLVHDAIERALIEAGEAHDVIQTQLSQPEGGMQLLDEVEDRLFALREASRKYRVGVDQLDGLLEETRRAVEGLDDSVNELESLDKQLASAWQDVEQAAAKLSKLRKSTSNRLVKAIEGEFAPLKLDRARFRVRFQDAEPETAGKQGFERAVFEISTNPGQGFGPLGKIASGGELSRLMLALKVVLARTQTTHSMVFDEVDSGVGGATAAAVGERLARLAREQQVLVVTHAPQVAARADHHLIVAKHASARSTDVGVDILQEDGRLDEIARMISGETVTKEARSAASALLRSREALQGAHA